IWKRRKRLREDRERVRHRIAELARVERVVEGPNLDVARDDPAERDRESRLTGAPVAGVREDDRVGAQFVAVTLEELREIGRPPLLLALDEYPDAHRRLTVVRPDRARVDHHAALVVGGPAPEEPSVLLDRFERIGVPEFVRARGQAAVMHE